ncbi:hypothetical protein EDD85DRAFT_797536 [Armillaria nabsnona]|nr:hypothetical protein EDD85DRAFT_797536 [Armillaria nabsnona]
MAEECVKKRNQIHLLHPGWDSNTDVNAKNELMTGDPRHGTEDRPWLLAIFGTKLAGLTLTRITISLQCITDVDKPCYISRGRFNVKALSSRAPLLDRDREKEENRGSSRLVNFAKRSQAEMQARSCRGPSLFDSSRIVRSTPHGRGGWLPVHTLIPSLPHSASYGLATTLVDGLYCCCRSSTTIVDSALAFEQRELSDRMRRSRRRPECQAQNDSSSIPSRDHTKTELPRLASAGPPCYQDHEHIPTLTEYSLLPPLPSLVGILPYQPRYHRVLGYARSGPSRGTGFCFSLVDVLPPLSWESCRSSCIDMALAITKAQLKRTFPWEDKDDKNIDGIQLSQGTMLLLGIEPTNDYTNRETGYLKIGVAVEDESMIGDRARILGYVSRTCNSHHGKATIGIKLAGLTRMWITLTISQETRNQAVGLTRMWTTSAISRARWRRRFIRVKAVPSHAPLLDLGCRGSGSGGRRSTPMFIVQVYIYALARPQLEGQFDAPPCEWGADDQGTAMMPGDRRVVSDANARLWRVVSEVRSFHRQGRCDEPRADDSQDEKKRRSQCPTPIQIAINQAAHRWREEARATLGIKLAGMIRMQINQLAISRASGCEE